MQGVKIADFKSEADDLKNSASKPDLESKPRQSITEGQPKKKRGRPPKSKESKSEPLKATNAQRRERMHKAATGVVMGECMIAGSLLNTDDVVPLDDDEKIRQNMIKGWEGVFQAFDWLPDERIIAMGILVESHATWYLWLKRKHGFKANIGGALGKIKGLFKRKKEGVKK